MSVKQGGFSNEVWNEADLVAYRNCGHPCGFFSGRSAKPAADAVVEATLRAKGWSVHEIAVWLTSSEARHFNDNNDRYTKIDEIYKRAANWSFTNYALEK